MELLIIAVVAVAIGALIYVNTNKGVVASEVREALDANNDGKVDIKDVKVVAAKAKTTAKTTAKKAAVKAKTVVRSAAKKAAAKKTTK